MQRHHHIRAILHAEHQTNLVAANMAALTMCQAPDLCTQCTKLPDILADSESCQGDSRDVNVLQLLQKATLLRHLDTGADPGANAHVQRQRLLPVQVQLQPLQLWRPAFCKVLLNRSFAECG